MLRKALTVTAVTLLSLAGATLPVASASADCGSAPQADPTPAPKKLFTIDDERVDESSGLAKSAKYDGIWWTVNDSGDSARVFGIDKTGEVKAELRLKADVKDVEAIAVDTDGTIYIADIGDNKATRDMIEVYTIPEPAELGGPGQRQVPPVRLRVPRRRARRRDAADRAGHEAAVLRHEVLEQGGLLRGAGDGVDARAPTS